MCIPHGLACTWFLKIAFVRDIGVRACVCVSAPEAINYIQVMIFNLYNQLNKFVALET